MDRHDLGGLIVVAGAVIVLIGAAVWVGLLSWFGRLPGDIHIENDNVRIYAPIVSMLLISAAVSLLLALLRRS